MNHIKLFQYVIYELKLDSDAVEIVYSEIEYGVDGKRTVRKIFSMCANSGQIADVEYGNANKIHLMVIKL